MLCYAMAWRPEKAFTVDKKGRRHLTPDYKSYLSNEIGMKADERKEWKSLGVHLTQKHEKRIVGFFCAVDFLEQPCNGNGNE